MMSNLQDSLVRGNRMPLGQVNAYSAPHGSQVTPEGEIQPTWWWLGKKIRAGHYSGDPVFCCQQSLEP